ncbi:MAG: hypothetical protein ACLTE2_05670 [Eubacteriales bacterium]
MAFFYPRVKGRFKKRIKEDQCSEYQKLQAKANEATSEYNVTPSKEKDDGTNNAFGVHHSNDEHNCWILSEQHIAGNDD